MTYYGWSGFDPQYAEMIAKGRMLEQARGLLGTELPESAAIAGLIAELGAGTSDDQVTFRPASTSSGDLLAAFALAKAAGGVLQLGLGTYELASQMLIDSPVTIRGQGWGSIIQVTGTGYIPILGQDSGTDDPITGVFLENFTVDGNQKGLVDSGLIQLNNCIGAVDRLWIKDGGTGSTYVNGISVSAGAVGGEPSQLTISRCLIEGCTKAGVNVTTESQNVRVVYNIVRANTGDLGQVPGIQVNGGHNAVLAFNSVSANQGDGIVVATVATTPETPSNYATILGNHVYNNGYAGIAVRNGYGSPGVFGRTLILGNQLYGNGSATSGHGIHVENQIDAIVHDNVVRTSYYAGLFINSATRVSVRGNTFRDNNTAGNTDLGAILLTAGNEIWITDNSGRNTEGGSNQKYFLTLYTTASSRVFVAHNDMRGNATAPLYIQTAPTHFTYRDNLRGDGDFTAVGADVGDAAATLTVGSSSATQRWATTLTADRAVTLSTTGAVNGDAFDIVRSAGGAFNLNVGTGPLKALGAGERCRVVFDGSAWFLTEYSTL